MKLLSDLHTHTVLSGHALSTLKEMAEAAKEKGIKVLGITDHGPALPGASVEIVFMLAKRWPREIDGVRILYGVEANAINDNGDLDVEEKFLERQDIVIAGLHRRCGYEEQGIEKNTEVTIKMIKNPLVKVLSHPYEENFPTDIERVAEAACANEKILEINTSYFYKSEQERTQAVKERMKKMVTVVKKNNQKVIISSDAHIFAEVGKIDGHEEWMPEIGLTEDDILNNDLEELGRRLNVDLT